MDKNFTHTTLFWPKIAAMAVFITILSDRGLLYDWRIWLAAAAYRVFCVIRDRSK